MLLGREAKGWVHCSHWEEQRLVSLPFSMPVVCASRQMSSGSVRSGYKVQSNDTLN